MANLIQIKQVALYVGHSPNIAECFACKKILDDYQIIYARAHIVNAEEQKSILANLSSNTYGVDFNELTFTDFPVITWLESYDDYERCLGVSTSSADLLTSILITHRDLIK
jgi:hypothetical protein